jgi:hypothetical protein
MTHDISSKWQTILLVLRTRSLIVFCPVSLFCKKKERKEGRRKETVISYFAARWQYNLQLCPLYKIQKSVKSKPRSRFYVTFHNILDFYGKELLSQ